MEKFITLRYLLVNIEQFEWSDALFLPEDAIWSLDTHCLVLDPDDVEDDADEVPRLAKDNNLMYTLGIQTIQDIVRNAYEQKIECTDVDLFKAFLYYYDNDAFIIIRS